MDEKLKSAIDYDLKRNGFSGLKPNQSEIIEAYLKGHHKFEFLKGHFSDSIFFMSLNLYELLFSQKRFLISQNYCHFLYHKIDFVKSKNRMCHIKKSILLYPNIRSIFLVSQTKFVISKIIL